MVTITMARGSATSSATGLAALYGRPTKTIYVIVDLVTEAARKGSALATGDVIQAIGLPANTVVTRCYSRVIEAADVSTLNVDIGTGNDADLYVDEGSLASLGLLQPTNHANGNYFAGTFGSATGTLAFTGTYDTIDVTLMTFSGTVPTTGQLAVFAEIMDLTVPAGANIADVQ